MAIKYYDKYPQRWESPSNDYPQGAFKNLSAIGENDGSYLEKDWLNDQSGFFGALLRNAEMTPNGLVDTAQKSQFYDALLACARKAVDLSDYYTKTQVDTNFYDKTEVDAEILANKTEVVNEWGDSLDKTLSQMFVKNNLGYVTPEMFGAGGDGITDDTEAVRQAVLSAISNSSSLMLKSVYAIYDEIEITSPILIQGIGSGSGYGLLTVVDFEQKCGFKLYGTGNKRRRTRYLSRESSSDLDDPLLSVGLNIQSQNVTLRDFDITLNFDKSQKDDHAYLGDDFDVGLFNGCRTHLSLQNVKVIGYFREACIRIDVTRADNLPEFKDVAGNAYPRGTVTNGADGLTLYNVYTHGGRWGLDIQGGIPTISGKYYDAEAGLVDDVRGQFGISDVTSIACSFYGADHHTGYRRNDFDGTGNKSSGAVNISGRAGNASGAIQGFRFISTRISSIEPFRLRLDLCNRFTSLGLHVEGRTSQHVKDTSGNHININDYNNYTYGHVFGDKVTNTCFYSNSFQMTSANLKWFKSANFTEIGGASNSLEQNVKSQTLDATNKINTNRIDSEELDIRTATGLRVRESNVSIATIKSGTSTIRSSIHSGVDATYDLGSTNYRYRNIHLSNQPTVTSDIKYKLNIENINSKYVQVFENLDFKQYSTKFDKELHFGIIAQDWISACNKVGVDPFESAVLAGSEEGGYAVRYGELQNLFNAYILSKFK